MGKKYLLSIFPSNAARDTVLTNNGLILDNICLNCTTEESIIDGNYTLSATFTLDQEGLYKNIQEEAILKARLDYGYDIFRIASVRKSGKTLEVLARQITISETLNLWVDVSSSGEINGEVIESNNGTTIIQNWIDRSVGVNEINISTDLNDSTLTSMRYKSATLYKLISEDFLNFFGQGEILRRGYNLTINTRVGVDTTTSIRSNKNLTGFEAYTNTDNLVTRIKPVGKDITIIGYIDSPLINNYSRVYTKEIMYDVKVKNSNDDEGFATVMQARSELTRLAYLEFTKNKIDEIKADYRINYIQLEKTEEYKDYSATERTFIGDSINVYEENFNINLRVRVLKRKYNVLSQRVTEVELSNIPLEVKQAPTVNQLLQDMRKEFENKDSTLADYIQSMINSGSTDSYVVYRQNEILIMDNKDINLATNVCRYNKHGQGFSQTGYYGQYTYGFTIDGKINASLISTGVLSAILIRSADGQNYIDLATGAIKFTKGLISGNGIVINLDTGKIQADKGLIKGSGLNIDLDTGEIKNEYTDSSGSYEVSIKNGTITSANRLWLESKESADLEVLVESGNSFWYRGFAVTKNGTRTLSYIRAEEIYLGLKNSDLYIGSNMHVTGTKECVQPNLKDTNEYVDNDGNIFKLYNSYYSTEDTECILTDMYSLKSFDTILNEKSGLYEREILIDSIYQDGVNLDFDYSVEIIEKSNWGDYRVPKELKLKDRFTVQFKEPNSFKVKISAKRRGFEEHRLDKVFIPIE